jgi:hypothetical protein
LRTQKLFHIFNDSKSPAEGKDQPMLLAMELAEGRLNPAAGREGNVLVYVNPDESERRHLVETFKID